MKKEAITLAVTTLLSGAVPCIFVRHEAFAQGHEGHADEANEESSTSQSPGPGAHAAHDEQRGMADCPSMQIWDSTTGMCMPLPMAKMPMTHVMVHGNAFVVGAVQDGPRGRDGVSAPNMMMGDIGKNFGGDHFLNVNVMATAERWTFPERGYPQLLQTGEHDAEERPYIDAQHPHSSPLMGLTLSDTIKIGSGKDHLKVFIAPRGQATDGPVAFMHRPTGMVNPDTPLGHHTGQDASHITSSVVGASLKISGSRFEVSAFNGREPEPTEVDLPVGELNSGAFRLVREFSPSVVAMASYAFVKEPEKDDPEIEFVRRYSASLYSDHSLSGCRFSNALILGAVNNYEHTKVLYAVTEEFLLRNLCCRNDVWGRVEMVQRTPDQLLLEDLDDRDRGRWVSALTLGYTHEVAKLSLGKVGLGISGTQTFLPKEFRSEYGGQPWAARIFMQVSGMQMWASR